MAGGVVIITTGWPWRPASETSSRPAPFHFYSSTQPGSWRQAEARQGKARPRRAQRRTRRKVDLLLHTLSPSGLLAHSLLSPYIRLQSTTSAGLGILHLPTSRLVLNGPRTSYLPLPIPDLRTCLDHISPTTSPSNESRVATIPTRMAMAPIPLLCLRLHQHKAETRARLVVVTEAT